MGAGADSEAVLDQPLLGTPARSLQRQRSGEFLMSVTRKGLKAFMSRPAKGSIKWRTESLDYEPVCNQVTLRTSNKPLERKIYGYSGETLVKNTISLSSGIMTGVIAWLIVKAANQIIHFRLVRTLALVGEGHSVGLVYGWLFISLSSCAMLGAVSLLVLYWAPAAKGAGVSQVMAYLNGSHVPELLKFRVLLTKILGTVAAVGSSLPLGPEGPMVHIGACIASNVTYCRCRGRYCGCFGGCLLPTACKQPYSHRRQLRTTGNQGANDACGELCEKWILHDDNDHREFISAGAAAGLAAAFGAPIGGVMFAWEEAASVWSHKLTWRCFISCSIAVFALMLLKHNSMAPGLLPFQEQGQTNNIVDYQFILQLPFICIVAAGGGLLGSLFNHMRSRISKAKPKAGILFGLAETLVVTFLCLSSMYGLALLRNTCTTCPVLKDGGHPWGTAADPCADYGIQLTCPKGQVNDLFTLFFEHPEETIEQLFAFQGNQCVGGDGMCGFSRESLAIHFSFTVVLMTLASGMAVPGGLFMPAIMIGSSFGSLLGSTLQLVFNEENGLVDTIGAINPGLYGLVGATALLGGVFRSSISLVVIVIEGTRQIGFLFHIIIAVAVSNWICHLIHSEGVYENDLERDGNIAFLRGDPPKALGKQTATDIMSPGVVGFQEIAPVAKILRVLKECTHNGFPVYCSPGQGPAGRLAGTIQRTQLLVLLYNSAFCDTTGKPLNQGPQAHIDKEEFEELMQHEMNTFHQQQGIWNRHIWSTETLEESSIIHEAILKSISETMVEYDNTPDRPAGMQRSGSEDDLLQEMAAIREKLASLYIDLRPYMNIAPMTVRRFCNGGRVHQIFTSLGMRHIYVVDALNKVVGVITRKDIDQASGTGWWRITRIATPLTPVAERPASFGRPRSRTWAAGSPRPESRPPLGSLREV